MCKGNKKEKSTEAWKSNIRKPNTLSMKDTLLVLTFLLLSSFQRSLQVSRLYFFYKNGSYLY